MSLGLWAELTSDMKHAPTQRPQQDGEDSEEEVPAVAGTVGRNNWSPDGGRMTVS